jgi:hypothetical protein
MSGAARERVCPGEASGRIVGPLAARFRDLGGRGLVLESLSASALGSVGQVVDSAQTLDTYRPVGYVTDPWPQSRNPHP